MEIGSLVIVHLRDPVEKYWGELRSLGQAGLTVRAVNLSSFDDWARAVAREAVPSIGLSTIFFPLHRVERMFLDEPTGEVESLGQQFARLTGRTFAAHLATAAGGERGAQNST